MRRLLKVLTAATALMCGHAMGNTVSGYLAYQYADEADHGVGPGFSYTIPLEYNFRVDARLSWYHFPDRDLDMIPLVLVGALEHELDSATTLYGGAGIGYYFLNANRGDADNDVGFQILGGAEWDLDRIPWKAFAELRWLFLEADVDRVFQQNEGTGSGVDLGGIGMNLGVTYTF